MQFDKIVKICPEHHGALLAIQAHYFEAYREKVPVTWILYRALDEYFSNPANVLPRHAILDSINASRPEGRALSPSGMLGDLDAFLLVASNGLRGTDAG
jgi:hypothetical protein